MLDIKKNQNHGCCEPNESRTYEIKASKYSLNIDQFICGRRSTLNQSLTHSFTQSISGARTHNTIDSNWCVDFSFVTFIILISFLYMAACTQHTKCRFIWMERNEASSAPPHTIEEDVFFKKKKFKKRNEAKNQMKEISENHSIIKYICFTDVDGWINWVKTEVHLISIIQCKYEYGHYSCMKL